MTAGPLFIGVDVGTGSARAGVFDGSGDLLGSAKHDIGLWREPGGLVEQSSSDIWSAVCAAVGGALKDAGAEAAAVKGIGFDATCSLVVLDSAGSPLPVGPSEDPQRDVIVWMDHRAIEQAARINATGHNVLRYVGGRISPEMQTPKLLWLKENRRSIFDRAGYFFDLSDFLTWRATGSTVRSLCTVTCKWTYLMHEGGWDKTYFRAIGLEEFCDEGFSRIGAEVADVGQPLGQGLTEQAAVELGLKPGTAVGASLIDAHAGSMGSLGAESCNIESELALIAGTSACTMNVTGQPIFVPGVWGPYFGALLPGYWLNEGGQSAFGAALGYIIAMHPAFQRAEAAAIAADLPVIAWLEKQAIETAGSLEQAAILAAHVHVVPELLGNRAPEADPEATAVIAGLRLDDSLEGLVKLFVATICGLSYGTREIIEALEAQGRHIETIVVSGGAAQSALFRRILCDATGKQVALPASPAPVLLGAALLGVTAWGLHRTVSDAATAMIGKRQTIEPLCGEIAAFHARKQKSYDILKNAERHIRIG